MTDPLKQREKPVLTPPAGEIRRETTNPLVIILVAFGLLVLIFLLIMVLWLLPKQTQAPTIHPPEQSVQKPEIPSSPQVSTTMNQENIQAEQVLGEWLQLLARAEAENVPGWGGGNYAEILAAAAEGDSSFRDGQPEAARENYQKAFNALERLLAAKETLLAEALEKGKAALAEQDAGTAEIAFTLALAIDPDKEEALRGAERAGRLDRVLELYEEGLRMENQGNLEEARKLLREARELDQEFDPAAEALGRIEDMLQSISFRDAMSLVLQGLDEGNLQDAAKALDSAARIRPDDHAVIEAGKRLTQMQKGRQLDALRLQAQQQITKENWEEVIKTYTSALAVDENAGFAAIGLAEAKQRLQLDKSLQSFIASPQRLQDEGPLIGARKLLAGAKRIDNPGPVLQKQIAALAALIENASMEIEVVLRSDNATELEVYHVGRFVPFMEKRLTLRPGTYTVVGRRPGFRDIRLSITIEPEMTLPVFFLRCEEPI